MDQTHTWTPNVDAHTWTPLSELLPRDCRHCRCRLRGQHARRTYTGWVTAKEQLQQLVAHLGEEQASRALRLLEPLGEELPENPQAPALPEFVGIGDSGRSDISERVDELLGEGFGR